MVVRRGSGLMLLAREGQGFVLVYSIAQRSTFERLETFRQSMLRVKRSKPVFMLVGNKADKSHEREVTKEEGLAMARSFGCDFLETSAKTAQNVDRLFVDLVRLLRATVKEPAPRVAIGPPNGGGSGKPRRPCVIC